MSGTTPVDPMAANGPADMLAVFTTVTSLDQADALARAAVDQHLAACVQIEAIHSIYRWQGEVVNEPEQRLMFKTTTDRYPALEAMLRERHPYEVPAIFALAVAESSPTYADWVRDTLDLASS